MEFFKRGYINGFLYILITMKMLIKKDLVCFKFSRAVILPFITIKQNGMLKDKGCDLIVNEDNSITLKKINSGDGKMKMLLQKDLFRIGNSTAVILPIEIIKQNGMYKDGKCELIVNDDDSILLRKVQK